MLLVCAGIFVYLLAWQFQGNKMVTYRSQAWSQTNDLGIPNNIIDINTTKTATVGTTSIDSITTNDTSSEDSQPAIVVSPLNALPQSFIRLWLALISNIMIDIKQIIITSNTNDISREGDRMTFVWDKAQAIWLDVSSITFYNDDSRAWTMVLMEIVHNNQSLLMQVPYAVYRDHKDHLNTLIAQLTSVSNN